jgi:hypothetical protein
MSRVALHIRPGDVAVTLVLWASPSLLVAVGWGYDVALPLRPWPQVVRGPTSADARLWSTATGWCGLFINVARPTGL